MRLLIAIGIALLLTLVAAPSAHAGPPVCLQKEYDLGIIGADVWITCGPALTLTACVPGGKCQEVGVGSGPA